MHIKIFGIHIERRTDILAFAAFIISIGTLLAQLFNIIQGPKVTTYKPRTITVYSEKAVDGKNYIRVAVPLTYLNNGSPGHNDFLKSEKLLLKYGNSKIVLSALNYISSKSNKKDKKDLIKEKKKDAIPVAIKSGELEYHETEFIPAVTTGKNLSKNFAETQKFLEQIQNIDTLTVEVTSEMYSKDILKIKCTIDASFLRHYLPPKAEKTINGIKQGWATVSCN